MRLLVSVASAAEAAAALAGGADLIDAKNPLEGPLGAVTAEAFREICAAVAGERPVTAALGDAADEAAVERTARAFATAGAALVKVGFAGTAGASRVARFIAAAARGTRYASHGQCDVVAVAYADSDGVTCIAPAALADISARAGATGVLLDTADKSGPGVCALMAPSALGSWVAGAHDHGLLVAIAGKLRIADLPLVRECGADIAGVRGAACEGGRTGCVTADRVRALRAACGTPSRDGRLALVGRYS